MGLEKRINDLEKKITPKDLNLPDIFIIITKPGDKSPTYYLSRDAEYRQISEEEYNSLHAETEE